MIEGDYEERLKEFSAEVRDYFRKYLRDTKYYVEKNCDCKFELNFELQKEYRLHKESLKFVFGGAEDFMDLEDPILYLESVCFVRETMDCFGS
jgi:hypothetical protein